MPLTCRNCGAISADGLSFCSQCGAPLTVPPGSVPGQGDQSWQPPNAPPYGGNAPGGYGPAGYGPGGYGPGPYYGPAPAHRLPMATIVGITVGLLGIVAAIGVLLSHRGAVAIPPSPRVATVVPAVPATATAIPTFTTVPQPTATTAIPPSATTIPSTVPTSTVAAAPTGTTAALSSPTTEAATATIPVPTSTVAAVSTSTEVVATEVVPAAPTSAPENPTAVPEGSPATGKLVTTSAFSVRVPDGWELTSNKANGNLTVVALDNPGTAPNAVELDAGPLTEAASADAILQRILSNFQQQLPDAASCANARAVTIGGVKGTMVGFCFTITPQSGAAFRALDVVWAATNADGTYEYVLFSLADVSNKQFFTNVGDVVDSVQWTGGR